MTEQRQDAPRLRFVSAEATKTPGSRIDVRVTLGLRLAGARRDTAERTFTGQASGVGDAILEPRLAVEATLAAIAEATDRPEPFRLIGIKVVAAFDTRVVLVCIRSRQGSPRPLVGAVPSQGDIARTAAMATLDATNRLVVQLLRSSEAERAGNR